MGSGTVGVVTHEMGGVYIGIDQSEAAVALARTRICGAPAAHVLAAVAVEEITNANVV